MTVAGIGQVGLNPAQVSLEETEEETDTWRRKSHEDGGRGWSDVEPSQGAPGAKKQEKSGRTFPRSLQTSGLRTTRERPPPPWFPVTRHGTLARQPRDTRAGSHLHGEAP